MSPALVYHPAYSVQLPSSHRFPMAKFQMLHKYLLDHDLASSDQLHKPMPISRRELELVHSRAYHEAFSRDRLSAAEQRRIGLPATQPLVRRSWLAVGGTLLTARLALQHGLACHLAGGTHHAFADYGSGFCIFNDIAVAARVLLAERAVRQLLVIDLDVHQGDGTAAIFAGDSRVFTLSAHAASNFPLHKQISDHDLNMADGLDDDAYLAEVGRVLPELLEQVKPDLVMYNAGVDPHRDDRLGRLSLSNTGLLLRDRMVLELCLRKGIPTATVIGGGYDAMEALVARHSLVFRAAREISLLIRL